MSVILFIHYFCLYLLTQYADLAHPASKAREIRHGATTAVDIERSRFRLACFKQRLSLVVRRRIQRMRIARCNTDIFCRYGIFPVLCRCEKEGRY